jgi:hypothetical protein
VCELIALADPVYIALIASMLQLLVTIYLRLVVQRALSERRKGLRVVVMSATLDVALFRDYFTSGTQTCGGMASNVERTDATQEAVSRPQPDGAGATSPGLVAPSAPIHAAAEQLKTERVDAGHAARRASKKAAARLAALDPRTRAFYDLASTNAMPDVPVASFVQSQQPRPNSQRSVDDSSVSIRHPVDGAQVHAAHISSVGRGLDSVASLSIPGRQHPVEILYTSNPQDSYLDAAVATVLQDHLNKGEATGDVLVFLPGQEDIEDAQV